MASTGRVGAHPLLKVAAGGALLWVGVRAYRGSKPYSDDQVRGRGGFVDFSVGGPHAMPPPPPPFHGPGPFPPHHFHHHEGGCPPPPPSVHGCCHCHCHCHRGFGGTHHDAFPPPPPGGFPPHQHHHHDKHPHGGPLRGGSEQKVDGAAGEKTQVEVKLQTGENCSTEKA